MFPQSLVLKGIDVHGEGDQVGRQTRVGNRSTTQKGLGQGY